MSNTTATTQEAHKGIYRTLRSDALVSHPPEYPQSYQDYTRTSPARQGYASYYPHEGPIDEDPNFH